MLVAVLFPRERVAFQLHRSMTKQEWSVFGRRPSVRLSYNCRVRDDCVFMNLPKWRKCEDTSRVRPVDVDFICAYFHGQDSASLK